MRRDEVNKKKLRRGSSVLESKKKIFRESQVIPYDYDHDIYVLHERDNVLNFIFQSNKI